jgi:Family of unknown function (DUF5703)
MMAEQRASQRPDALVPAYGEYEWRVLTLPRGISRVEACGILADQAEYGDWELARVRLYMGGTRRVWLRRRIIRVVRTDGQRYASRQ